MGVRDMSFETLLEQYKGYIDWFSARPIGYYTSEDIQQEMKVTLFNAYNAFEEEGTAQFKTYFVRCCWNRLLMLKRHFSLKKRTPPGGNLINIDNIEEVWASDMNETMEQNIVVNSEEAKKLKSWILNGEYTKAQWRRFGMTDDQINIGMSEIEQLIIEEKEVV